MTVKRYMELCQINAIKWKSVKCLTDDGLSYYPWKIIGQFDKQGKLAYVGLLVDIEQEKSVRYENVIKLQEAEK